jgi:hypothetical protein
MNRTVKLLLFLALLGSLSCTTPNPHADDPDWVTSISGIQSLLKFIQRNPDISDKRVISIVYEKPGVVQVITGSIYAGDLYVIRRNKNRWEITRSGFRSG